MRIVRLVCLSFLLCAPALADDIDPALLQDYIGLTKLLQANGVDPITVNWAAIEPQCLGLKSETDQTSYNRCRYEKAMDTVDYPSDSTTCSDDARANYPDSLLTGQTTIVTTNGSSTHSNIVQQQPLSPADLSAKRTAAFNDCMNTKGWRDPNNAARGRK